MIKKWDAPIWEKKDELIGSIIVEVEGGELITARFGKDGIKMYLISAIPEDLGIADLVVSEFNTEKVDMVFKKAIELLKLEGVKK